MEAINFEIETTSRKSAPRISVTERDAVECVPVLSFIPWLLITIANEDRIRDRNCTSNEGHSASSLGRRAACHSVLLHESVYCTVPRCGTVVAQNYKLEESGYKIENN